jgi:putative peptidoglycan lipid II flippase
MKVGTGTDRSAAPSGLARVVFSLSTIAVLTKIFGFAEKFVIAHFFGTGDAADVYFATTALVLSTVWLVRELVNPSLLPVFAASLGAADAESSLLFRRIFFVTAGLLAVAAALIAGGAPVLTRILVPGFAGLKGQMTARLLRLMAPAVLVLGLSMVAGTVLNAHRKFVKAAWPEAAFKVFVVVGLIALLPRLGLYALAVVMGLGGFGCLALQVSYIPERGALLRRPAGETAEAALRRVGRLMTPLVVGVIFSHLNGLVDNILASTLPTGQLSFLGYSRKLIDALLLIGPVALVTVVYSELSHRVSAHDTQGFLRLVRNAFRVLTYLSVPTACLLTVLAQPLIRVLFQRGHFGVESTFGTSQAFLVHATGLTVFSLEVLLVHSFFALSDTKTPIKIGILCSLLDVALALALLRPLEYLGIAGAFVIARTCKVVLLAVLLNRRWAGIFGPHLPDFFVRLAVSAAAMGITTKLLLGIVNADSVVGTTVFDLLLPAAAGAAVFALSSCLLGIHEFGAVLALIRHRRAAIRTLYQEAE